MPAGKGRLEQWAPPLPDPTAPSHSHAGHTDQEGATASTPLLLTALACACAGSQGAGEPLSAVMLCRQGFDSRSGMRPAEHVKLGCHWEQGRMAALSSPPQPLYTKLDCFRS